MGIFSSKLERAETAISDKLTQRAALQREINMAVDLARSRDTLLIYSHLYVTFVTGLGVALAMKKPVPVTMAIPAVMGGFALGNMYDYAYGNKLIRVVKEAEYILEHEKGRFVPPKHAPFHKYYTECVPDFEAGPTAVSTHWPSWMPVARKSTAGDN